jgi:hypothetical protein
MTALKDKNQCPVTRNYFEKAAGSSKNLETTDWEVL